MERLIKYDNIEFKVNDLRSVEVWLSAEMTWVPVRMADLKKGETFRFFEDDKWVKCIAESDGYWVDRNGRKSLLAQFEKDSGGYYGGIEGNMIKDDA